jgi:hypothetical protein
MLLEQAFQHKNWFRAVGNKRGKRA